MDDRFGFSISFAFIELIETAAEIGQRPLGPVMLVRYLHFQIDGMAVIDDQMDVEDKVPVLNSFSELNGILNPDFCNIFHFDMQKG